MHIICIICCHVCTFCFSCLPNAIHTKFRIMCKLMIFQVLWKLWAVLNGQKSNGRKRKLREREKKLESFASINLQERHTKNQQFCSHCILYILDYRWFYRIWAAFQHRSGYAFRLTIHINKILNASSPFKLSRFFRSGLFFFFFHFKVPAYIFLLVDDC